MNFKFSDFVEMNGQGLESVEKVMVSMGEREEVSLERKTGDKLWMWGQLPEMKSELWMMI